MIDQEKTNLEHIVKNKNLLLYGKDNLAHLNTVFSLFKTKINQEVTAHSILMLNNTISENNIDVIILCLEENNEAIYDILLAVKEYEEIFIFICLNQNNFNEDLINISNSTFTQNITQDLFCNKLYLNLNNRILNINRDDKIEETYMDSFELEIIFIRDELIYISQKIDSGDISENTLQRVYQSVNRINRIFENYLIYSKKIKKSMRYFAKMLETVDFKKATISNITSFEYLSRIVEDIAVFLDNYFIKRNFTDLYIIEDSLENSLKFLKDSFEEKKVDNSSLEFFDD